MNFRLIFSTSVITIVLLTLSSLLSLGTFAVDVTEHSRYLSTLLQLQELDTRLNQDVLKAHEGLLPHYDTLVRHLNNLQRLNELLNEIPSFISIPQQRKIKQLLQQYQSYSQHKEKLIDRFKSKNAILRNSLSYLPIAVTDTAEDFEQDAAKFDLTRLLRNLLRDVLIYYAIGDEAPVTKIKHQLTELSQNPQTIFANIEGLPVATVIAHAEIILIEKKKLEQIIKELIDIPSYSLSMTLLQTYDASYLDAVSIKNRYQLGILSLFCVLIIGVASSVVLTLRRSARALRHANQQLYELANLDGLTQIANRRRFDQCLSDEWQRLKRECKPLALILCDVDFFKNYNDYYGHQQGDQCLIQIAQALTTAVKRPADLLARYGGEEFAVVLPDTGTNGALKVAASLQQQVRQLRIPHSRSKIAQQVTISIGVTSQTPGEDHPPQYFIELADQALYQAKINGRNQIVLKTPSATS